MVKTSQYWTAKTSPKEVKRLKKQEKKLKEELKLLRERDVLRAKIHRQKSEKFHRSRLGIIRVQTRKL